MTKTVNVALISIIFSAVVSNPIDSASASRIDTEIFFFRRKVANKVDQTGGSIPVRFSQRSWKTLSLLGGVTRRISTF